MLILWLFICGVLFSFTSVGGKMLEGKVQNSLREYLLTAF